MMIIKNPDNLPMSFIEAEITDLEKITNHKLKEITFKRLTKDECLEEYKLHTVPFERIRRISGYLVGTTDRWNNGKKAELKDRVKHN